MKPLLYTAPIQGFITEAENTTTFFFEKPKGFEYKAGQFIRLILFDEAGIKHSRYLTLSSSPTDKNLAVTVKLHDSPFKNLLYKLSVKDTFQFYGAMGQFFLPDDVTGQIIMLSGGIGITPFASMMKYASEEGLPITMRLFASFHSKADLPLAILQDLHVAGFSRLNLHTTIHVTNGEGRLNWAQVEQEVDDMSTATIYLCGSDEFVESWEKQLKELEITNIKKELFI